MLAERKTVGLLQVILYEGLKLFMLKVTGGGAGLTASRTVTLQPTWSITVITLTPACKFVALNEFPATDPGVGLQVIIGFAEADPTQVKLAADMVLVHPAWVKEASAIGAGVMLTVRTLFTGAQPPGWLKVSITVPDWLPNNVPFVAEGTVRLAGTVI